ncbi:family 16 glycosylhydrolase [Aurantiacibacter flavus]|uniref:Family 16 glycosylhydrolase n=1 Tax=Aurantiacibacter flavus TaxID=3145232 RepID=A0ABV0CT89_9SPHN
MWKYATKVGPIFTGCSVCAVVMVAGLGAELPAAVESICIGEDITTTSLDCNTGDAVSPRFKGLGNGVYYSESGAKGRSSADPDTASSGSDQTLGTGDLPSIDISTMMLFDYSQRWHASNWDHGFSDIPWKFDHVTANGSDIVLRLDDTGAPELKGVGQEGHYRGVWEADVTLPDMREGFVAAPLWLYTKYNDGMAGEIDFEFTRLGLQLTLHSEHTGAHKQHGVTVMAGQDWSGQRYKLGIRADIRAGYIEMYVNGEKVHTFRRSDSPDAFPTEPMIPLMSMWTAKSGLGWAEGWLGKWDGGTQTMTVHGYAYSPF